MKYKFRKRDLSFGTMDKESITYDIGVEVLDDSIAALENIEWWGWTEEEAQMIIDESKKIKEKEIYEYTVQGSELTISVDKDYVYFFDWKTPQEEEDFSWTFDTFIKFMEEFKIFIRENS